MEIENLIRPHILSLKPYTGREPFPEENGIYLNRNENTAGSPAGKNLHRFPDVLQVTLKEKISAIKGLPTPHIFLGNQTHEAIDLLIKVFCEPGRDKVMVCSPGSDVYAFAAATNNVSATTVNLTHGFHLDVPAMIKALDEHTRIVFIGSPNEISGNSMRYDDIEFLLNNFMGIVVVDETYINYSRQRSFIRELTEYENLVVLQTFSHAWGLAGAGLGMAFSTTMIVDLLNRVKLPYNISQATENIVLEALEKINDVNEQIKKTVGERTGLIKTILEKKLALEIFPSDANFILARFNDAEKLYTWLKENGIWVKNVTKMPLCDNCLRLTVGTPDENMILLNRLADFYQEQ